MGKKKTNAVVQEVKIPPAETKKPITKKKAVAKVMSIDQLTIARSIAMRLNMNIADVAQVIELEQKMTMNYVKRGFKVIKKNYITIIPKEVPGKKWISPLNGIEYEIPARTQIYLRAGDGFKNYVSGNASKMPNKICRFIEKNEIKEPEIAVT